MCGSSHPTNLAEVTRLVHEDSGSRQKTRLEADAETMLGNLEK